MKNQNKKILGFLICLMFSARAFAEDIVVALNEKHQWQMPSIQKVWVEDGKLFQVSTAGRSVIVKPLKVGSGIVSINSKAYMIHAVVPATASVYKSLKLSVRQFIGLSAAVLDGEVLIKGRLYRFSDWLGLNQAVQTSYNNSNLFAGYVLSAEVPRAIQNQIQIYLDKKLQQSGLRPQKILFGDRLSVSLNPEDSHLNLFRKVLGTYGIAVKADVKAIQTLPTIKVDITIAEVRKNQTLKYGMKWPAQFAAKVINGEVNSEFEFSLSALEARGEGKILARPNLICRSGDQADFFAGGEFPIKILNYKIQDIVWKKYGVTLKIKPKADESGNISLNVETEVSSLDDARKVDNIPGVFTNHVSTNFDLRENQMIALSGLIKNESGHDTDGIPGLANIPILGSLFGSKDFRDHQTELVIFVKPSIMNP